MYDGIKGLYNFLRDVSGKNDPILIMRAINITMRKIFAIDDLDRALSYYRAREIRFGDAEKNYKKALKIIDKVESTTELKKAYELALKEIEKTEIDENREVLHVDLAYGEYVVKQYSISNGYVVDDKEYIVNVSNGDNKLILDNYVISNVLGINKYYCYLDECNKENNAQFDIYDLNNNKVGSIVTDESGYGSIKLDYGKYLVKQVSGLEGYIWSPGE